MLVRRSLYVRSLTGVLQFGAGKRDSLVPTSPLPLGALEGVLRKRPFLKKEKFFEKTGETPSVTGGLRTGDSKKIESIRINLRDLAWSQVFPRDPGLLQPWNPRLALDRLRVPDLKSIVTDSTSYFCAVLTPRHRQDTVFTMR